MQIGSMDGKVAIVTGSAQGIGLAVARSLAEHGALVAVLDVDAAGADRVAAELVGLGHQAAAYQLDVRDSTAVNTVVKRVEHELGPVGVLVNVAGVLRTGPIVECSDQDWADIFAVNATGVFHLSRAVARAMVQRRSGSIVTIASNAGGVPRMHMAAYAASKAAATHFTKCLGLELSGHDIRCNIVSPGSTDTAMLRSMLSDAGSDAAGVIAGAPALFKVGIPLRRLAEPADVADAVIFLASDRARHITMQEIFVDGGAVLGG
ncbi:2,3-dihydro-2,3-dihydroxybenzoate dehydrogenase [Dactylosporangium sp. NPDC049525]|uniref:2,3-dihydro-2,3-dihydroxybenzoate dehydrogenase n=1 Tax=Dactylosporangium sp. NPDC049525 TaxID=3154730 RepID=UPI00344A84DB